MKRYKQRYKEEIASVTVEFNSNMSTDEKVLRIAIASELSAINLYQDLVSNTNNEFLKKLLLDITKEEKVHIGEFETLLNQIDVEQVKSNTDGNIEVQNLKNENYKMERYKRIFNEKELTYKQKQDLPDSAFVFPKERKYPIPDEAPARNALSRVSANGTPEEIRKVKAAVKSKFPSIEVGD